MSWKKDSVIMGPMEIKWLQITLSCTRNYIITYRFHTIDHSLTKSNLIEKLRNFVWYICINFCFTGKKYLASVWELFSFDFIRLCFVYRQNNLYTTEFYYRRPLSFDIGLYGNYCTTVAHKPHHYHASFSIDMWYLGL